MVVSSADSGWWVVTSGPARRPALAAAAETAGRPLRLGDLGGGVAQRRADLVDLDLVDGALLAFLGLIRSLPQAALDDDPHAALQALRDVLGSLPPDIAGKEQRVAVLPLVRLPVHEPWGRRDPEGGHGLAGGGVAEFGVGDEVADNGDRGVACCHRVLPVFRVGGFWGLRPRNGRGRQPAQCASGRRILVRRIASFRFSWRSSSLTVPGSAVRSITV